MVNMSILECIKDYEKNNEKLNRIKNNSTQYNTVWNSIQIFNGIWSAKLLAETCYNSKENKSQ